MDEFGRRYHGDRIRPAGRGRGATLPAYMTNPGQFGSATSNGAPRQGTNHRAEHQHQTDFRRGRPDQSYGATYGREGASSSHFKADTGFNPQHMGGYDRTSGGTGGYYQRLGPRSEAELVARARYREHLPIPWIWGPDPAPAKVRPPSVPLPEAANSKATKEADVKSASGELKSSPVQPGRSSRDETQPDRKRRRADEVVASVTRTSAATAETQPPTMPATQFGYSKPSGGESYKNHRDPNSGSESESDDEGPRPTYGAVVGDAALEVRAYARESERQRAAAAGGGFGGAMRPGEGAAMAAFAAEGQRIPRRGEVSWSGDYISMLEKMGYVMTGSRNKRMEEVRLRKEGQVYTAEERRALAQVSFEKEQEKEEALMSTIRGIVEQKGFGPSSAVASGRAEGEGAGEGKA